LYSCRREKEEIGARVYREQTQLGRFVESSGTGFAEVNKKKSVELSAFRLHTIHCAYEDHAIAASPFTRRTDGHDNTGSSTRRLPCSTVNPSASAAAPFLTKREALKVGACLSIYNSVDEIFREAIMRRRNGNLVHVEFVEDGSTEWIDLSRRIFKVL
jgi:hypothetical protein